MSSNAKNQRAQQHDDEFSIQDEELDQLREKYNNSYRLYGECLKFDPESLSSGRAKDVKISNRNGLYDLEPALQSKIREIALRKFYRNSFTKDLDLYPTVVHDGLQKKLGVKTTTEEFVKVMCKHFKKYSGLCGEQYGFMFKKMVTFHTEYHAHENFSQLQQVLELYCKKLLRKKAFYMEMCSRMSQGLLGEEQEMPQINMQQGNKLIFSHKQKQPAQHNPVKILDYKLYLNDKIKKYKMTRNLRKFNEVIKYLPLTIMSKLHPIKERATERRFGFQNDSHSERESLLDELNPVEPEDHFIEYRNIKDLDTLKQRLIVVCNSFGITEDPNVDNGALLLFTVDCFFKDTYAEQQKQLDFMIEEIRLPTDHHSSTFTRQSTHTQPNISVKDQNFSKINGRVRYLKKATWLEDFTDYEDIDISKKFKEAVYGDRFDSLLKSWFDFVQIADSKECLIKLEFRLNRLKDQFDEKKMHQQEVFFELLRAYMKLLVLKARGHILKIYDSLNFFRSVERTITLRKQDIHMPSKAEFADSVLKTLASYTSHNNMTRSNEDKEDYYYNNDVGNAPRDKMFAVDVIKNLQEDKSTFMQNGIDIRYSDNQLIMYDVVLKDFEKITAEVLRTGAHFIDMNKEKKGKKGIFSTVVDDIDREKLLVGLLEHESKYLFAKAKYVKQLMEVFRNTFTFKQSMSLMKYIQETIAKRPQLNLFDESIKLSYNEETRYFENFEALAMSLISFQKDHENSFNEFQRQVFSAEEEEDLVNIHKEMFQPPVYSLSARSSGNKGTIEDHSDSILGWDNNSVKALEKEVNLLKPYESLSKIFPLLMEVEKAAENAVRQLNTDHKGLAWVFDTRKMVVEEAYETWEQIRYNLSLVPSIRDYEILQCDVLMDIPTSSYNLLKQPEGTQPNPSESGLSSPKSGMISKNEVGDLAQTSYRPASGVSSKNNAVNTGGKKNNNELISEEKYLKNFIEFVKLKEVLLISLLSSAYQAQTYLYQTKAFGKDLMYRELADKPGDFQKHFLSLLLNLEGLQFLFNLKDIGDSRLIVMDSSKLEDLRTMAEYILLHEFLLQNALYTNHYYMIDVIHHAPKNSSSFIRHMQSPHSQGLFFNIMEKKNNWFLQAKVNPAIFTGKIGKADKTSTTVEWSRSKMEAIQEVTKFIRRYVFFDALKIQTIEVSRSLRTLIRKSGLDDKEIFRMTDIYTEERSADQMPESNEMIPDTHEEIPEKRKTKFEKALEEYFDETGRWKNPFIIPSAQDIIHTDLEDKHQKSIQTQQAAAPPQQKGAGHVSFAQKISQAYDEEVVVKRVKRKRVKEVQEDPTRPQLEFLRECRIMYMLEWSHSMMQILTYEMMHTTMQANSFDLMLLYEGGPKDKEVNQRYELRIVQSLSLFVSWLKKFKEYVNHVLRTRKPGETRNVAKDVLDQTVKYKSQIMLLACLQSAKEARKKGDIEAVKVLRRFMIRNSLNTMNYLYRYNEKLCFNEYFCDLQNRKDSFMKAISFHDSEIMRILDFVFMEPLLKKESKSALYFSNFMNEYAREHNGLLTDLFLLNRGVKAQVNARMSEMNQALDQMLIVKNISPQDNLTQYTREINKCIKKNLKTLLAQEALLCLKSKYRPFTEVQEEIRANSEKNVQYHYTRAFNMYIEEKKNREIQAGKNPTDKKATEEDIHSFHTDEEKINILKNVLIIELDKMLLQEGTAYYMKSVGSMWRASKSRIDTNFKDVPISKNEKEKILENMNQHRFLPFFYGFTSKILNKSLFIDAHNVGECIVIPLSELEHQLYDLNKGVVEYFEEVEYDVQRKYDGKVAILKSQLEDMTQKYDKISHKLSSVLKDQERAVEARLAEEGTKMVFQVDMLKKKVNYILEEQEFLLKETKEKVRQEFRDKLVEDEVALKRLKKRFHEYKEGMSYDLRRFIEGEKNQTLKAIIDKKNHIFLTGQPESAGHKAGEHAGDQEDPFEMDEEEDGRLVSKLYELLKKTRVLYQFREIVVREKCQREINEMKKKVMGNQNLMHKLNDLQNSEANLRDGLTEAKKEIAIMEKRNKILGKTLQKDTNEKIRLYRESATSQLNNSEIQMKYDDVLKRKAIFISTDEPTAGNVTQSKFFLKAHVDALGGSMSQQSLMVESLEMSPEPNRKFNGRQKSMHSGELLKSMLDKKRIVSDSASPSRVVRPTTGSYKMSIRSPSNMSELNLLTDDRSKERPGSVSGQKAKTSSFIEVKSPSQPKMFGFNLKSGKKVRKSDEKGFLVKKFVQKDDPQ